MSATTGGPVHAQAVRVIDAALAEFDGAPEVLLHYMIEAAAAGLALRRGHALAVRVSVEGGGAVTELWTGPERAA